MQKLCFQKRFSGIIKYLTPGELKKFFSVIDNEYHKACFAFLFYTGLRIKEALNLEWKDIDFENNLIVVRNKTGFHTKNYKERVIPIHPNLKPWLEKLKKLSNGSNKVIRYKSPAHINHLFVDYSRKSGVHCTPHKLRHSFATLLASQGVSLKAIQELLGHTRITTTEIYAKMAKEYLKESIKQLNVDLG